MTASASGIDVVPVSGRREREEFIGVPWPIYRDDPCWVPPLRADMRQRLDPAQNPFFRRGEAQLFVARRGRRAVGRISAQVNQAHLEQHRDATGHFGFLEAEDDPEVFAALLQAVGDWLRQRGMERIVGPLSFSTNEETGVLVEGFDTPPMLRMPHGRPCYAGQLEALGFGKLRDLYSYRLDPRQPLSPWFERLARGVGQSQRLRVRRIEPKRLVHEIVDLVGIFNESWAGNWGFVPMTDHDAIHLAESMRPLLKKDYLVVVEVDGEPAGVCIGVFDLNEAIHDLDGKLLPFGWARLLWRTWRQRFKNGRLAFGGVVPRYQQGPMAAAIAAAIGQALQEAARRDGIERVEASWLLEENPMRPLLEAISAVPYKTYRVFEKTL